MEPNRKRFDRGAFATLDRGRKPQRFLGSELDELGVGALRRGIESSEGVLRAHDPEIVLALAETELAAILAGIVRKCCRHFADLPASRA